MQKQVQTNKKAKKNWSAWNDYAPKLHRFLVSRLSSNEDAQDLMQEAYLRLIRIEKPELVRHPEVYLFRIASNLVGEFFLKKRSIPQSLHIDDIANEEAHSDKGAFEASIYYKQQLKDLEAIFSEMPPLYKEVLLLRKQDGLSHTEIAERLEISPHTVHKYITRALAQCRTRWSEKTSE